MCVRDRQTDRQTDRDRQRETQRDRETDDRGGGELIKRRQLL